MIYYRDLIYYQSYVIVIRHGLSRCKKKLGNSDLFNDKDIYKI